MPGWVKINGQEYYLGPLEPMSWDVAEAKALEAGAYLAEITTRLENDIFGEIKNCELTNLGLLLSIADLTRYAYLLI